MTKKEGDMPKKSINGKKFPMIPSIKDYSSSEKWKEISWRNILESKKLLSLLITSHEKHDLIMRVAISEGLSLGKGQRQLSRELSVSLQTINAVKKAIAENNYRSYLERSKKERKKKKYSPNSISPKIAGKGRPVRTKYGTVYMPY